MNHYLSYEDEKSNKFWKIEVTGNEYTVTYGEIGTTVTSKTKRFDSEDVCLANAENIIEQKLKKGYVVSNNEDSSTIAVPSIKKETVEKKQVLNNKSLIGTEIPVAQKDTIKDPVSGIKEIEALIALNELIGAGVLCEQLLLLDLSLEQEEAAHMLQGYIALLKNDFEIAEIALKQGGVPAYFLLGELYTKTEDYTEAFTYYEKVNTYTSLCKAGSIAKDNGMLESSIEYFKRALELGEKDNKEVWKCYQQLGEIYHTIDAELAEQYYIKALAGDQTDDSVYNNLAVLYISVDRYEDALKVLDDAIAIFPGEHMGYLNKSRVYALDNKLDDANHWLGKAFYNGYDDDDENIIELEYDSDFNVLRTTQAFKDLKEVYSYDNRYVDYYDYDSIMEKLMNHPESILSLYLSYISEEDVVLLENIGRAFNLKELHIKNAEYFPQEIYQLKKLKKLILEERLYTNWIEKIPKAFLEMELEEVDLALSELESLPFSLSKMKGLKNLELNYFNARTLFRAIPKEIAHFKTLRQLKICHIQISQIDREIGSLYNLEELIIEKTAIPNLPKEIGDIKGLDSLIIIDNANLKYLPEEIGNIKGLYSLKIINNRKLKYLPESIFTLPKLVNVTFSKNGFPSREATKLFEESIERKTDKRIMAIFLAILQGNKEYIAQYAQRSDILQALNSSVGMLRTNALIWLEERGVETPIDESSEVLILGKFSISSIALKKEIAEMGISIAKKWSETTTHIIIGEKPGDKLISLLDKPICWVIEAQLQLQSDNDSQNAPVEITEAVKKQITTLLLSSEDINVMIALEMIQVSESKSVFETELFLAYQFSGDQKNKKTILSLIKRERPKLHSVFIKKYGFKTASELKVNKSIAQISERAGFDENRISHIIERYRHASSRVINIDTNGYMIKDSTKIEDGVFKNPSFEKLIITESNIRVPPAIGQLGMLKELKFVNNTITYLPAELLDLEDTFVFFENNKPDFIQQAGVLLFDLQQKKITKPQAKVYLKLLQQDTSGMTADVIDTIIQALDYRIKRVQEVAMEVLSRLLPVVASIEAGSVIAILGKPSSFVVSDIKHRFKNVSVSYQNKITTKTTHIVVCKEPGLQGQSIDPAKTIVCTENNFITWLNLADKQLLSEKTEENTAALENVSEMLLGNDIEHIELALVMMKTHGVSKELLTDLFIFFNRLSDIDAVMKKKAKSLFRNRAPEKLLEFLIKNKCSYYKTMEGHYNKSEFYDFLSEYPVMDQTRIAFYLNRDKFFEMPEAFDYLKKLKHLSLTFTYKFPEVITKLHDLEVLEIDETLFEEIPEEIRALQKLKRVIVFGVDDNLDKIIKEKKSFFPEDCVITKKE